MSVADTGALGYGVFMRIRALALSLGIMASVGVAIVLYLAVNQGHIGAWCDSVDNCSGSPELSGIAFVSLAVGLLVAGVVLLVGRALNRGPGS
jgi:hypothetical protein